MSAYTITCDYTATGEGRTIFLMYVYAQDEEKAKHIFAERFGQYFVKGIEIKEGFDTDNNFAELLLTPKIKNMIDAHNCDVFYSSEFHFNYS